MANKVGKYQLLRKLATGGMAEVFLARFEWAGGLEKTVVVKRILYHLVEDPTFIDMFFTEAQLASQLSHPNIAQIIEFGESEGVYFLAMEYIDGPSLRALASAAHAAGGIPFALCARIIAFCCEALTYAHELTDATTGTPLNLVHRDVSPDNILVSRSGSVKLVDFGIAKAATQNHQTKTGLVKGKLAYMAPEQLRAAPLDGRADIFSLGVVLYELVSGAKPYDAPSESTLIHAMLYEDPVPLRDRRKDVPPELERIVDKALEHDRDKRYPSCRAMHADLEEYLIATRQPVSALQIAQLVEQHRPTQVGAEGTPARAMMTPNRSVVPARTPEPWRAERTPAGDATAQLRQPRLRTGTDGDQGDAGAPPVVRAPAPVAAVEKLELVPPPEPVRAAVPTPSRPQPEASPQVRRTEESRKRAMKPWALAALGAAVSVVLIASAVVLLRLVQPVQPKPLEPPPEATQEMDAGVQAEAIAAIAPEPQMPEPSPTPPPPPDKKPPPTATAPMVELVLKSEPPGLLRVYEGGKERASHSSPLTAHLRPGVVDVEAVGTSGGQSFSKREQITVALTRKRMEYTIVVKQEMVMIRSAPASQVRIDGTPSGETPLQVKLYEGKHAVKFECDSSVPKCAGLADATQTVTVEAGKPIQMTQRWQ